MERFDGLREEKRRIVSRGEIITKGQKRKHCLPSFLSQPGIGKSHVDRAKRRIGCRLYCETIQLNIRWTIAFRTISCSSSTKLKTHLKRSFPDLGKGFTNHQLVHIRIALLKTVIVRYSVGVFLLTASESRIIADIVTQRCWGSSDDVLHSSGGDPTQKIGMVFDADRDGCKRRGAYNFSFHFFLCSEL